MPSTRTRRIRTVIGASAATLALAGSLTAAAVVSTPAVRASTVPAVASAAAGDTVTGGTTATTPGTTAAPGTTGTTTRGQRAQAGGQAAGAAGTSALTVVAQALGLQPQVVAANLQQGATIADLAQAQGVDAATVEAALVTFGRTEVAAELSAGDITQAQASTILGELSAWAAAQVTGATSGGTTSGGTTSGGTTSGGTGGTTGTTDSGTGVAEGQT